MRYLLALSLLLCVVSAQYTNDTNETTLENNTVSEPVAPFEAPETADTT